MTEGWNKAEARAWYGIAFVAIVAAAGLWWVGLWAYAIIAGVWAAASIRKGWRQAREPDDPPWDDDA
jgi:hypothetical protein